MPTPFLVGLGFDTDPFEYTDADREPHLQEYFVPPPYFQSVLGDPRQAASALVFAPRGSGKSAQRRMIEEKGEQSLDSDEPFITVTYDTFDPSGYSPAGASWEYHINQIIRGLVLRLLIALDEDPWRMDDYSSSEREFLSACVNTFLTSVTADQYEFALKCIRTAREKLNLFLDKYGGPLSLAANVILHKMNLSTTASIDGMGNARGISNDRRAVFENLIRLVEKSGFQSVYVLVDRVDETSFTGQRPADAYALIRSLLADLATLNTPSAGFKFFLWDKLEEEHEPYARPDRIRQYSLNWRVDDLSLMLQRRLEAYSGGRVSSFNAFFNESVGLDAHQLMCFLGNGKPRDMIRACAKVVTEHIRVGTPGTKVSKQLLLSSIWDFSVEISEELCNLSEIKRAGAWTFTVNDLANNIFRIERNAMMAKVKKWCDTNVAVQIGTAPGEARTGRPRNLYAIIDPRVGIATRSRDEVELVLLGGLYACPDCGSLVLSEASTIICNKCHSETSSQSVRSLWDLTTIAETGADGPQRLPLPPS